MLRFVFIIVIFTRNMKFYTLQKFPTIQYNTCTLSYFAAFLCFSINNYYCYATGQWSVDSLAHSLKAHPRLVRKHLGFWVSHGLLKEVSSDVYELIQEQNFNRASTTRKQD